MDRIIDIHTHVLYGVDDGARSLEESLSIIDSLKGLGIYDIVLTSHYIKDTRYEANVKTRKKILDEIKENVNDSDVNLYLGNEVFMCDEVVDLLKEKEITTLNKSRYMLVELPLTNYLSNYQNILCDLTEIGVIPIIAHPERYRFIQKDKERIKELLDYGCLLQCNIESLDGKYGSDAKKVFKWLIKKNYVTFVATDTHRVVDSNKLLSTYNKLKKLVSDYKYRELTYINPKKVLNDEDILNNYLNKGNDW